MNLQNIIQDLADQGHEIYSKVCKVISVDQDKRTCDVNPIDDDDDIIYGVRLQSDMNETTGFVMIPAVGSYVVVTFLNKSTGYVGLMAKVDEIRLNGDQYGGLIKVEKLVEELDKTKAVVNAMKQAFQGWTPAPQDGGAALKALVISLDALDLGMYTNLENVLVKHG